MKKLLFAFSALLLLCSFVACTPEDNNGESGETKNNPDELTVTGEALDITDYSATLTGYANLPLDMGNAEVGIVYDKVKSFEDARKVVATELDGNNKFTVTATDLLPSTTYYYKSYVQNGMAIKYGTVKSFTTKEYKFPDGAVDLGIIMTREDGTTYKLYWAKSNLCVSGLCANPEDCGDYYAWGETVPKSNYGWSTYKWCNGSSSSLTKYYNNISYGPFDNKAVLDSEDDAASSHTKLGGRWRVPKDTEWTALREQCTWTSATQNDVNGRLVKATNGNSIFLPDAGVFDGNVLAVVGQSGYYWSSSLKTDNPVSAWAVYINLDGVFRQVYFRCYGLSIRPVYEEPNP